MDVEMSTCRQNQSRSRTSNEGPKWISQIENIHVDNEKDIDVIFDKELKFDVHIVTTIKKAN